MLVGLVLAAMVVVAGTLAWTGWLGPPVLVLVSLTWIVVNHPMEGRTLLVLDQQHGITAGDLAGVAGVAVALLRALVLLAEFRRRH